VSTDGQESHACTWRVLRKLGKKGKATPEQAMETQRVVRYQGSQMAVRLSVLCTSSPLPPERFLVLIPVRGWVVPRAIVWLEGLGQSKNPMTSSKIKPTTFYLVAWCLN
jgi:hypothetical protein